MVSGFVVLFIAIVALFPGFFATQGPQESNAMGSFIPVQRIHFWDDGPSLFVYGVDRRAQSQDSADGVADR